MVEDPVDATRRAASPGERLDPPLLLLDEAANIAPLPSLPNRLADGGGSGITTVAVLQSLAQARTRGPLRRGRAVGRGHHQGRARRPRPHRRPDADLQRLRHQPRCRRPARRSRRTDQRNARGRIIVGGPRQQRAAPDVQRRGARTDEKPDRSTAGSSCGRRVLTGHRLLDSRGGRAAAGPRLRQVPRAPAGSRVVGCARSCPSRGGLLERPR